MAMNTLRPVVLQMVQAAVVLQMVQAAVVLQMVQAAVVLQMVQAVVVLQMDLLSRLVEDTDNHTDQDTRHYSLVQPYRWLQDKQQ
jgi:hypothetical protein